MKVKLLTKTATIPCKATPDAAGFDLFADMPPNELKAIFPGEGMRIPTGIAIEIPNGYFGGIYPRSGLATKEGLRLANCVGVIDSDYRGEILVPLYNDSNDVKFIGGGARIAQLIISPYKSNEILEQVEELDETKRGSGGFGSTGSY